MRHFSWKFWRNVYQSVLVSGNLPCLKKFWLLTCKWCSWWHLGQKFRLQLLQKSIGNQLCWHNQNVNINIITLIKTIIENSIKAKEPQVIYWNAILFLFPDKTKILLKSGEKCRCYQISKGVSRNLYIFWIFFT